MLHMKLVYIWYANMVFIEVEAGIEVEDEIEVDEEAGEGAILEAEEAEEEEVDDEGTGAPSVDITSYFPEASVSAGKVSEVLVSVKVSFEKLQERYNNVSKGVEIVSRVSINYLTV